MLITVIVNMMKSQRTICNNEFRKNGLEPETHYEHVHNP